ncbi:uncharacterized protein TM35_000621280 [Trypanosoma theileri]|uniref:Mucin-associated surface protein (MASP) n=1 Tax=Trypanosoma theileri TaxID=67003 RepID=A0A1X0NFW6_9TRYP|nr:uncharacterized protein TM35_000621280 [Trypanosoma theileri]ORC83654.1 hypothetical protein TM35_000621280 [Trypanosoma theileri]
MMMRPVVCLVVFLLSVAYVCVEANGQPGAADGLGGTGGVDLECRTGTTHTDGKCIANKEPRLEGKNENKGWDESNEGLGKDGVTNGKRIYHPGVSDLDVIDDVLKVPKGDTTSIKQELADNLRGGAKGPNPGETLQREEEGVHSHVTHPEEGQLETQKGHERKESRDPESTLQQTKETRENENLVQEDREVARPSVPSVGEPESIPVETTATVPSPTKAAKPHSAPEGTPESERTVNPPTGEHTTEEVNTNQTNPQSQSESTPTTSQETNTTTPPSTENTTAEAPTTTSSPVANAVITNIASTVKNKGNADSSSSISPVWMRTAAPLLIVAVLVSVTVY